MTIHGGQTGRACYLPDEAETGNTIPVYQGRAERLSTEKAASYGIVCQRWRRGRLWMIWQSRRLHYLKEAEQKSTVGGSLFAPQSAKRERITRPKKNGLREQV